MVENLVVAKFHGAAKRIKDEVEKYKRRAEEFGEGRRREKERNGLWRLVAGKRER